MRLGIPMPMGTPRSILFDVVRPLDDEDKGGDDDGRDEDEGANDDEDGDEDVDEILFEGAVVKEWLAVEFSEVERAPEVVDGCTWWSVGRKYWPSSSWWPASAQPSLSPLE